MIELSTQKQLALLFPHSNKALMQSLQQATPEQLATLSEAKDLSSLLKGLITDTLDVKKSNTIILEILKNSEFFKEMGNFSKELKSLVDYLNTGESLKKHPQKESLDSTLKGLEAHLQKLTPSDGHTLKTDFINSGVFFESKLAQHINNPNPITTQLEKLLTQLQHSQTPQTKTLLEQLSTLLGSPETSAGKASTLTQAFKEGIQNLLEQFKSMQAHKDPLYSLPVEKLLSHLKSLTTTHFPHPAQLHHALEELVSELRVSKEAALTPLLQKASEISTQLEQTLHKDKSVSALSQLIEKLQTLAHSKPLDNTQANTLENSIEKLSQLTRLAPREREAIHAQIVQFIQQLPQQFPLLKTEGLLDLVHRILDALKTPTPDADTAQKNVHNWVKNIEQLINKSDPLFSASVHKDFQQLEQMLKSPQQTQHTLFQEEMQKDLKAMLMHLESELPKGTSAEVMKQVDKLLVQVEYFQLLSHLSNGSHLYLPLQWSQLDNGHIAIKKGKDHSSYCEIDLELCEYGKLNIMLQLFEENQLNMTILTEQDQLKTLFTEHVHELRTRLKSIEIMPRNIHIRQLDTQEKENPYGQKNQLNELGFEVKG